jgi:hypothetical protein
MSTTSPVRFVCPECRRENEPERIYCHDCGTRLDHSHLGPSQAESVETSAEVHKRVTGMFAQRGARTRVFLFKCVKLIVAAGAVAAIVLIFLPPPALPPMTKSEVLPPQINLDLEGMTQFHRPPELHYSEAEVNSYLAYVLGKKKEMLDHLTLDFERAVLTLHPSRCEMTIGRSLFGFSIYTAGMFSVQLESGKLTVVPLSGAIGHLPIHPALMRYTSFFFGDVARALDRERKLLGHVGSMELREKEIVIAK